MFLITKKVKLIEKKKFIVTTFNLDYEVFVIYIIVLNISFNIDNKMYPLQKA